MQCSGLSLVQSLVIGEPIKFCVIAMIMSCLPTKTKQRCIKCMQTMSVCSSVVGLMIGMTLVALADNIDIDGALEELTDMDADMEVEMEADADADMDVEAGADADGFGGDDGTDYSNAGDIDNQNTNDGSF
jgi:hypothetical protein